ncbi:hypothetical protein REPUB_Repub05bG0050700 [Reevesia pubescens]
MEHARKVVNLLDGVWLLDYWIGVYMAKFNGRSSFWNKILNPIGPNNELKVKQVSLGNSDMENEVVPSVSSYNADDKQILRKSYVQALKDGGNSISSFDMIGKLNSCHGVVDDETLHKLESCVVGLAKDYCEVSSLIENFRMSGTKVSGMEHSSFSNKPRVSYDVLIRPGAKNDPIGCSVKVGEFIVAAECSNSSGPRLGMDSVQNVGLGDISMNGILSIINREHDKGLVL